MGAPYSATTGEWTSDTTNPKAINQGSPTLVLINSAGTDYDAWWLITSAEFFQNSGTFTAKVSADISGVAGADMAAATYGQIWSAWVFKADDGATIAIGSTEPD